MQKKLIQSFPDRVRYFNSLIHDKVPYVGYRLLCLLNKYLIVESVWTTNFDGMAERAAHQMNITPKVITLDNQQDIYRTISNTELMCISLHGDYKYSTLKILLLNLITSLKFSVRL